MPTDWGGGAGADIGRTLVELGRIRGENMVQQGNIWGHAIANIGNTIEQAPLRQMQQQEMQARAAELQGLAQDRQMKAQQMQRLAAGQQALSQQLNDPANIDPETGAVDHRKVATTLGQQGYADMGESYLKQAAANEEAFAKLDERKQHLYAVLGRGAARVSSPEDFTSLLAVSHQLGVPQAFLDHISQEADARGPDGWKAVSQQLADMTGSKATDPKTREITVTNPDGTQTIQIVEDKAGQTFTSAAKPAGAEKDDQRYEQIQQAILLKQPVSAEDVAWSRAYEKRKTVGPEATAAAAADRQAVTIQQQTAQQGRAQAFTESQAGRKEYTDKVAAPYQTALASAQTLRDTVAAAQSGNKVAGNLQNLETAMAAIRSQGLNRINTSEIGVAADAGSLWDRAQSFFGKVASGQPVDASLQKDILQFADILEKSATQKYQKGRNSLLEVYPGSKLPDESGGSAAAPPSTGPAAGARPSAPTVGSTVMFQGKRYKVTGIRNGAATLEAIQ